MAVHRGRGRGGRGSDVGRRHGLDTSPQMRYHAPGGLGNPLHARFSWRHRSLRFNTVVRECSRSLLRGESEFHNMLRIVRRSNKERKHITLSGLEMETLARTRATSSETSMDGRNASPMARVHLSTCGRLGPMTSASQPSQCLSK